MDSDEQKIPELYSEEEIKELLKNDERLVYVDNGYDEFVVRYEDLPDCIVDVAMQDMSVELKVIDYKSYDTLATTYGFFLNRCDPDVREDIIERLQELQLGEKEIKPYKIIDEDTLEKVENNLSEIKRSDRDAR